MLVKKFLELVEMTSRLVNTSFSLPEWYSVKMVSFAPLISAIILKSLLRPLSIFQLVLSSPNFRCCVYVAFYLYLFVAVVKKVNLNPALYINFVFPDQANSYTLL